MHHDCPYHGVVRCNSKYTHTLVLDMMVHVTKSCDGDATFSGVNFHLLTMFPDPVSLQFENYLLACIEKPNDTNRYTLGSLYVCTLIS